MVSKRPYYFNGILTALIIYSDGSIYRTDKEKFLTPWKNNGGYLNIHICYNGIEIRKSVHQLVAETFIENPENKPQINHIDGNKENNNVENLEWVTQNENMKHAHDTRLATSKQADECHFSKYTRKQVTRACKEIERDNLSMKEISKLTGIPLKTLYEIRSGKIWNSISKNFKFPKRKYKEPDSKMIGISHKTEKKIKKMIKEGYKYREIAKKLNLEWSKSLHTHMRYLRMKYNKLAKEAQRLSKNSIDNDIIYEETLIFSEDRIK